MREAGVNDPAKKMLRHIRRRRHERFMKRLYGGSSVRVAEEQGPVVSERFLKHIEKTRAKPSPTAARTQGARRSITSLPLP